MINKSETIGEIAKALVKFQSIVKQPKKNADVNINYGNVKKSYKYSTLDELQETIKEAMAECGLVAIQDVHTNGAVEVSTLLMHVSGEYLETSAVTFQVTDGKPQTIGSLITYGRRYSLSAALGLSSESDTDANDAQEAAERHQQPQTQAPKMGTAPNSTSQNVITEAQAKRMFAISKNNENIVREVLNEYGYEKSIEVKKADYNAICNEIIQKAN